MLLPCALLNALLFLRGLGALIVPLLLLGALLRLLVLILPLLLLGALLCLLVLILPLLLLSTLSGLLVLVLLRLLLLLVLVLPLLLLSMLLLGRLALLLRMLLFRFRLLLLALLLGMVLLFALLLVLRVRRSRDSEKQTQKGCAGESNYFHSVSNIYGSLHSLALARASCGRVDRAVDNFAGHKELSSPVLLAPGRVVSS